jgi:hypothetical protein
VVFLLRPETVAFDVTGPTGFGDTEPAPSTRCSWVGSPPSPIAEAFTHSGVHGKSELTVLLDALCPEHTFDAPGLYFVRARLDTQRASGRSIGLATFDGEVLAEGVTRVRIRKGNGAHAASAHPELAEANATPAH